MLWLIAENRTLVFAWASKWLRWADRTYQLLHVVVLYPIVLLTILLYCDDGGDDADDGIAGHTDIW